MRSTIITFSARSFSLARSSSASAASLAGSSPRGRVPLIGRVRTIAPPRPGRTSRKRSGLALSRAIRPRPHEAAVMRRRRRAQSRVRLDGIDGCLDLEPRRQAQLVGVTLADRVATAFDERGVLGRGVAGPRGPVPGGRRRQGWLGDRAESGHDTRDVVRPAEDVDPLGAVIERDQAINAQPEVLRHAVVILRCRGVRARRGGVIAAPADPAAAEGGAAMRLVVGARRAGAHGRGRTGRIVGRARAHPAPALACAGSGIQPEDVRFMARTRRRRRMPDPPSAQPPGRRRCPTSSQVRGARPASRLVA